MPGSVRPEESGGRSGWRRTAEVAAWCVVRLTLLLSTLVCVELWHKQRRRRPRLRQKNGDWAMALRNFFF